MNGTAVDPAQMQHIMAAMVPLIGLLVLLFNVILIIPFWVAFKKAGLSPWLSLLELIPGIGLLLTLYILAFARWRVIPMAPEYPAYPAPAGYVQPGYTQGQVPAQSYATPPTAAYPPPSAAVYPPVEPPREE